jgi:NSS family neurotransmitter:Na+ symporter
MGLAGTLIAFLFFIALAFAGLTSAVSIVEPTAMYMTRRFDMSRIKALVILGATAYILGIMALMSNIETLKSYVTFFGKGVFDILDIATTSILLPLGGLLIAIFVGYVIQKERLIALLGHQMSPTVFAIWYITLRFVVPLSIVAVMVNQLFFS